MARKLGFELHPERYESRGGSIVFKKSYLEEKKAEAKRKRQQKKLMEQLNKQIEKAMR